MEANFSPAARFMMRTPWVARPMVEMPETRARNTLPELVINMTSSSLRTWATLTTGPFRSVVRMVMIPCPPRRFE